MSTGAYRISIGLEEGVDGAILAHGLTIPGCTALGANAADALAGFEVALRGWIALGAAIGAPTPPDDAEIELAVDEWLRTDAHVAASESTVCFAADVAALTDAEIDEALRMLGALRARLLGRVRRLPDAALDAESPAGWTARQILEELARAAWWTLSRLGASPLAELPPATFGRLDTAIALVIQQFAHLAAERRAAQLVLEGEEWTPRKVLRRLLWLESALGRAAVSALAPISPEPTR